MRVVSIVCLIGSMLITAQAHASDPELCKSSARQMVRLAKKGEEIGCKVMGKVWLKPASYWYRQCMFEPDKYAFNVMEIGRLVTSCEQANGGGGGGGGGQVKAVRGTDVYDNNDGNGNLICSMNGGDSGSFLGKKEGEPNWVKVGRISGGCGGKTGWVWDGGTLKID